MLAGQPSWTGAAGGPQFWIRRARRGLQIEQSVGPASTLNFLFADHTLRAIAKRYAVRSDAVAQPVGLAANVRVSGTGYKSRPSGRLGAEFVSFFRNTWLRSLRASLFFRSRWKRALSPLRSDMMGQEYQNPVGVDRQLFR
jgi:hypothetical protein